MRAMSMAQATMKSKWMEDIFANVGQFVRLETIDGVNREGRMSGLRLRQLELNGKTVEIITELELNGDPTDCVEIYRVAKLDFG
jgi:hypothetical protein